MIPGPYLNAHCRSLGIFSEHFDREWKIVLDGLHTFSKYFICSFVCIIGIHISFIVNYRHHTDLFQYIFWKKLILVSIGVLCKTVHKTASIINPLNPKLNPICYLLLLLGAHHFLHVSRIRVKLLTFRLLISYIYIYIYMEHPFLMFLDHTQRRSTVGRTPLDE